MGRRLKLETGLCRAVVLCAGLGFVLGGCASDGVPDDVAKATEKPVTIEIVPQYDTDPTKTIDTSHLPKKTIQTPWGPRQIPDQSKNPELLAAVETLKKIKLQDFHNETNHQAYNDIIQATKIQSSDLLRVGCSELINSFCELNTYLFPNDCGKNHNFGSSELSKCESKNLWGISRRPIAYSHCNINQKIHESFSSNLHQRIAESNSPISEVLNYECKIWRGEDGWNMPSADRLIISSNGEVISKNQRR